MIAAIGRSGVEGGESPSGNRVVVGAQVSGSAIAEVELMDNLPFLGGRMGGGAAK